MLDKFLQNAIEDAGATGRLREMIGRVTFAIAVLRCFAAEIWNAFIPLASAALLSASAIRWRCPFCRLRSTIRKSWRPSTVPSALRHAW